ncbi:hypothetical protein D4T62_10570 [Salmonella enterica subsp. enterica]|nr:hypothetical protein [Salmonella enterica subsp. enterica]EDR3673582.1 hypothetical protein [Salmonella enterica subsp. arizonae serovar 40:z4,z24:]
MEQQKEIDLDGIKYYMTPANAYSAWENLQLLLGAIGRSKMDHPGDGSMSAVLGLAFSVMDKPELAAVQRLIFEYTVVKPENGAPAKLIDCGDTHFNQYRAHLPILLVEGAQYQFGDFFTGIRSVLAGLFPGLEQMTAFLEKCRSLVSPETLAAE